MCVPLPANAFFCTAHMASPEPAVHLMLFLLGMSNKEEE